MSRTAYLRNRVFTIVRLVLNGRFLGRPVTGVERMAIHLTRAMREILAGLYPAGHDIDVIAPVGEAYRSTLPALGTPAPAFAAIGRLHGHAWEQTELLRVRPDSWLLNLCNMAPITRRRQAVVICDAMYIDHPESFSRGFRWWYRIAQTVIGRRAAAIFTISEFSRAALERHRLVPPGKTQVLRLGIDHMDALEADDGILARTDVQPGGYLLVIGSLARHKNLALLIDAFVDAGVEGLDLVIAGGGNRRIHGDVILRDAGNIRYTGRVSDAELKALYTHAMAFACPSISEGFGFTPLEAMSTGCPVIATTGGAVPEICGNAAVYADPHDRTAWRDAIRRIATDETLRNELKELARLQASRFTWRHAALQMLTALARHDGNHTLIEALERQSENVYNAPN